MITNDTAARQISDLMIDLKDQMMDSLTNVKETCSPEEYASYHEAVGRIAHSILVNVLEPSFEAVYACSCIEPGYLYPLKNVGTRDR